MSGVCVCMVCTPGGKGVMACISGRSAVVVVVMVGQSGRGGVLSCLLVNTDLSSGRSLSLSPSTHPLSFCSNILNAFSTRRLQCCARTICSRTVLRVVLCAKQGCLVIWHNGSPDNDPASLPLVREFCM